MSLIKASDDIKYSDDAVVYIYNSTYTKRKSITITNECVGTLRVVFDLQGHPSVPTAYAKIYYNGSPIGTERAKTNFGYETFSEDFSGIKLNNGDTIELWGKLDTVYNVGSVRNFRVEFDLILPDNSMFAVF